jgi:type II secretory pathway pseudopilin PulG
MKLKLIQGSKTNSQQGFSLLEAMIASMVSLTFLSLGANLVLASNLQKIVAKRNIAMNNFIQSDLDGIKYQANILAKADAACKSTSSNPSAWTATNGYAVALKNKIAQPTSPLEMKIMGQDYKMIRTLGPVRDQDPNILPISYEFIRYEPTDSRVQESKYKLYTEIIPNAAFTCPAT